jgi:hypothetical protein
MYINPFYNIESTDREANALFKNTLFKTEIYGISYLYARMIFCKLNRNTIKRINT